MKIACILISYIPICQEGLISATLFLSLLTSLLPLLLASIQRCVTLVFRRMDGGMGGARMKSGWMGGAGMGMNVGGGG